jgi:hypothetical protein
MMCPMVRISRRRRPRSDGALVVEGIQVERPSTHLLPATSLVLPRGGIVVAIGSTEIHTTALALALAGRLRLTEGVVHADGDARRRTLQRRVALVDVPTVSDPEPGIPFRTVVKEELALTPRRHGIRKTARWLKERNLGPVAGTPLTDLPGPLRLESLAELASYRSGVEYLVLGYPERHGIPVEYWADTASAFAERGFGVLVTASHALADVGEHVVIGDAAAPPPEPSVSVQRTETDGEATSVWFFDEERE